MEIRSFKAMWSNSDSQKDGNPQLLVQTRANTSDTSGVVTWVFIQDLVDEGWQFVALCNTDAIRKPNDLMVIMVRKRKGLE